MYENSDVIWRGSGGKEQDVIVLLTSRLLVFLVEKDNEKYNIATLQDISPPVIQLKRLMSRSVATGMHDRNISEPFLYNTTLFFL